MDEKIDLRVLKTKKNIYEALIKLLEKSVFEDIKVSEICEEAMINRSTFYSHFEDKYALFNCFINDLKESLRSELSKNKNISSSKEYYIEVIKLLLSHFELKKDIYKTCLINNRNSIAMDMIYSTLKEDIQKHIKDNENITHSELISNFYLGAIVNVGMEWLNNSSYTKEDIIKYSDLLIPEKAFWEEI